MVPVAYIEHQLPGRARLRIPSRRGEVPFFESVVQKLSKHPSIRELNASPLTGSITLQYLEPLQAITATAADQRLFEICRLEPKTNASESKRADRLSDGPELATAIASGLSGLSLSQIVQGNVLGSATENLWHAFGAQRILGRPDIATAFVALGLYQMLRGRLFGSASSLFFYALVMRQMAVMEHARARGWAVAARSASGSGVGSHAGTGAAGSHFTKTD